MNQKWRGTIREKILMLVLISIIPLSCILAGYFSTPHRDKDWFSTSSGKQYNSGEMRVSSNESNLILNYSYLNDKLESLGYNFITPSEDQNSSLNDSYYWDYHYWFCIKGNNSHRGGVAYFHDIVGNCSEYYVPYVSINPGPSESTRAIYNFINEINGLVELSSINWTSARWSWSWMTMTSEGVDLYYGYPLQYRGPQY